METNCNKCWVKIIVKHSRYMCNACYRDYMKAYRSRDSYKTKYNEYFKNYMVEYRKGILLNKLDKKRLWQIEV